MITKSDRQLLIQDMKEVFATKDDVKMVIETALTPIKKDLKSIKGELDTTIKHFDTQLNYHHRRLNQLEKQAGVEPPSYSILPASAN